ncbi:hypothetical protein BHE74_00015215 [Ensete ventricosum]|nr:hypothetical protein BHE74_00015215 [Ensete ventricosum]
MDRSDWRLRRGLPESSSACPSYYVLVHQYVSTQQIFNTGPVHEMTNPGLKQREHDMLLSFSYCTQERLCVYFKDRCFVLYRPVQAVCTGSIADRYADCPLPGGTAKINRRRSIEGEIDHQRSIEGEKGKKKKKRRRRKKKRRRRKKRIRTSFPRAVLARMPSPPARRPRPRVAREARAPLQIWVLEKSNNLLTEEGDGRNIFLKMSWFVRANESLDVLDEEYDSSKDEVSSVSSYNPSRGNFDLPYRSSLSLQSIASRLSSNDFHNFQADRTTVPSHVPLAQLSVAEAIDDPGAGTYVCNFDLYCPYRAVHTVPPGYRYADCSLPGENKKKKRGRKNTSLARRPRPSAVAAHGFHVCRRRPRVARSSGRFFSRARRRSVSPRVEKDRGDMLSHPGALNMQVQSEHHEVVADLVQTSFLFSIPIDGPISFSTPKVSVQWSLRFEFFTTPKDLDLSR